MMELYCRWIVGTSEIDDEARELFEAWGYWHMIAKLGSDVQSIDHNDV